MVLPQGGERQVIQGEVQRTTSQSADRTTSWAVGWTWYTAGRWLCRASLMDRIGLCEELKLLQAERRQARVPLCCRFCRENCFPCWSTTSNLLSSQKKKKNMLLDTKEDSLKKLFLRKRTESFQTDQRFSDSADFGASQETEFQTQILLMWAETQPQKYFSGYSCWQKRGAGLSVSKEESVKTH